MASPLVSVRTAVICALSAAVSGSVGMVTLVAEVPAPEALKYSVAAFGPAVAFFHRAVAAEAGTRRGKGCCG